jgi:hypothetical protein
MEMIPVLSLRPSAARRSNVRQAPLAGMDQLIGETVLVAPVRVRPLRAKQLQRVEREIYNGSNLIMLREYCDRQA